MLPGRASVQLKVKALLVRVAGYTPGGHGLRELLGLLARALEGAGAGEAAAELAGLVASMRGVEDA